MGEALSGVVFAGFSFFMFFSFFSFFSTLSCLSNLAVLSFLSSTSPRTVDVCRVGFETRPGSKDEKLEIELAAVLDDEEKEEDEKDEVADDEEKEAVDERDVVPGPEPETKSDVLLAALATLAAVGITIAGAFEGTTIVESRDSGAFGPCVLPWPLAWFVEADGAFTEAPVASLWPLLLLLPP